MIPTDLVQVKQITLKTNHNHKLDCDRFIHIQPTPAKALNELVAEKTVFKIATADNSHSPVLARIYDSVRLPLRELSPQYIWLSHGIEADEFCKLVTQQPGITTDTEMTVYFYKKEFIQE